VGQQTVTCGHSGAVPECVGAKAVRHPGSVPRRHTPTASPAVANISRELSIALPLALAFARHWPLGSDQLIRTKLSTLTQDYSYLFSTKVMPVRQNKKMQTKNANKKT